MSDAPDSADEYAEKINNDVSDWVEDLARKGVRSFKLTECKEKFMVIPINLLSNACEALVSRKRIVLDPTSRRIAAYTMHPTFIANVEKKKAAVEENAKAALADYQAALAKEKAAQAREKAAQAKVNADAAKAILAEQARKKAAPTEANSYAAKVIIAEQARKKAALEKAVADAAKAIIAEQDLKRKQQEGKAATAAASASAAKKQKVAEAPLGTKKISSFFAVQSAPRLQPAPHPQPAPHQQPAPHPQPAQSGASVSVDVSSAADENTAPLVKSSSSANLSAVQGAEDEPSFNSRPTPVRKPTASAPLVRTFKIVDVIIPSSAPQQTLEKCPRAGVDSAVSEELQNLIMQVIPDAFLCSGGSIDVQSLLQRCLEEYSALHPGSAPVEEAAVQGVLRGLESRNVIMIDDGVIYEV